MSLTPAQIALVRGSFDRIRENLAPPSAYFYETLFRHAPELRPMFRDDLEGQGMRFMSTLALVVDHLDAPERLEARFAELGRLHAVLGVHPEHFKPMEEALIDTLRNRLGDDMTPETEAAWRAAYEDLSAEIVRRGAIH